MEGEPFFPKMGNLQLALIHICKDNEISLINSEKKDKWWKPRKFME